jgi:Asp-tRNA(Asn)/Glu-tRNA(Gln) amidotransferase A subunit family amidase
VTLLARQTSLPRPMPAGATFHGRLFEEGKMLVLAHAVESRLNVWQYHPSIA